MATPVGPMPAPSSLTCVSGAKEGTIAVRWNTVYRADSYMLESAPSDSGPWTQVYVGGKARFKATGLTSLQSYYFRVNAVGADGPGPWSDTAKARAT